MTDLSLMPGCLEWGDVSPAASSLANSWLFWTLHPHPEETVLQCQDHATMAAAEAMTPAFGGLAPVASTPGKWGGFGRLCTRREKPPWANDPAHPAASLTQSARGISSVTQKKAHGWCNARLVIGAYVRLAISGIGSLAQAGLIARIKICAQACHTSLPALQAGYLSVLLD
jgi:hypothetical protein